MVEPFVSRGGRGEGADSRLGVEARLALDWEVGREARGRMGLLCLFSIAGGGGGGFVDAMARVMSSTAEGVCLTPPGILVDERVKLARLKTSRASASLLLLASTKLGGPEATRQ